jgi:hypothetical protein
MGTAVCLVPVCCEIAAITKLIYYVPGKCYLVPYCCQWGPNMVVESPCMRNYQIWLTAEVRLCVCMYACMRVSPSCTRYSLGYLLKRLNENNR